MLPFLQVFIVLISGGWRWRWRCRGAAAGFATGIAFTGCGGYMYLAAVAMICSSVVGVGAKQCSQPYKNGDHFFSF